MSANMACTSTVSLRCYAQFSETVVSTAQRRTAATRCVGDSRTGRPQIFNPAKAFLLLDRYACEIDLAALSVRVLEFLTTPEFDGGQTSGSPRVVTARLECISTPHSERGFSRPRRWAKVI